MTQSTGDEESTPGRTASSNEPADSVAVTDDAREPAAIGPERPATGGLRAARRMRAGSARRLPARPAASFVIPETLMRQALEEVEQQVHAVMEHARARIDEIARRTRGLLDDVVAVGPEIEHVGTVVLEAGPFADLPRFVAFEAGLDAIPTIDRIVILSFAEHRVRFELHVDDPTRLAEELRSRTALAVDVLDAGESSLRLDVAGRA